MKKLKFVLISLLCSTALCASPVSLELGLGNDIWTFGISQNNDDGLSFSSHLTYNDTRFSTQLSYAGITNRGCKIGDEFVSGRYDIIALDFIYDDLQYDSENFVFTFKPSIGFSVAGNLGLDKVQNFVHISGELNTVSLPYEEGYIYSPRLGFLSEVGYAFPFESKSRSTLSLGVKYLSALMLASERYAYVNFAITSADKPVLNFTFGYESIKGYTSWSTQKLYHYIADGYYGSFNFRFGALAIDYKTFFKSRVGYCTYSCNLLSFANKSTFKEADLYYTVLFTMLLNKNYHESEFMKEIRDTNFYLGVANRYFSASHLKSVDRETGAATSYCAKCMYAYDLKWLTPFVSLGLGFTNFSFVTYSDPTSEHIYDIDTAFTFSSDISIGLKLLPETFLTWDNVAYSLLLKGGVVINPDENVSRKYLSPYTPSWPNFSFLPYFSIGGVIAIDLI